MYDRIPLGSDAFIVAYDYKYVTVLGCYHFYDRDIIIVIIRIIIYFWQVLNTDSVDVKFVGYNLVKFVGYNLEISYRRHVCNVYFQALFHA